MRMPLLPEIEILHPYETESIANLNEHHDGMSLCL